MKKKSIPILVFGEGKLGESRLGGKQVDEKRLLELKEQYKHKRNRHKQDSNHYWRYSGKIEAINDIVQELKGNKCNTGRG